LTEIVMASSSSSSSSRGKAVGDTGVSEDTCSATVTARPVFATVTNDAGPEGLVEDFQIAGAGLEAGIMEDSTGAAAAGALSMADSSELVAAVVKESSMADRMVWKYA